MRLTAEFTLLEDGWYMVRCLEVDGAISQGRYPEEARDMIRDAIRMMLEDTPSRPEESSSCERSTRRRRARVRN